MTSQGRGGEVYFLTWIEDNKLFLSSPQNNTSGWQCSHSPNTVAFTTDVATVDPPGGPPISIGDKIMAVDSISRSFVEVNVLAINVNKYGATITVSGRNSVFSKEGRFEPTVRGERQESNHGALGNKTYPWMGRQAGD